MVKAIFKFILFFSCLLIAICNVNAGHLVNSNDMYYYEIDTALLDIEKDIIGKHANKSQEYGVVKVVKQNDQINVVLLQDAIINHSIKLNNIVFDLNGYSLIINSDEGIMVDGITEIISSIPGGRIVSRTNDVTLVSIWRKSTCTINGVNIDINANDGNLCGVHVYGNLNLVNSNILINGNPTKDNNPSVYGVYGNLFSRVKIDNSNIEAYTQDGSAYAVFNGDSAEVKNSTLTGFSNYMSNESAFTQYSVGCYNNGTLTLTNCNVSGIHSGVDSCGSLIINGGTYSGFGHGGVYFAGCGQTSYVKNATLQEMDMPDGYVAQGPISTNAGCYIGGGERNDNLTVYMNNCSIFASKHSIVLRGSSGEQNNQVYVSNTTIDVLSVRIDNDTHKLHIGIGCNFDQEHTTLPNVVYLTEDIYCEEQN